MTRCTEVDREMQSATSLKRPSRHARSSHARRGGRAAKGSRRTAQATTPLRRRVGAAVGNVLIASFVAARVTDTAVALAAVAVGAGHSLSAQDVEVESAWSCKTRFSPTGYSL
eukprot:6175507-Pleurochrysis_carterae.AAC.6